jgi:hypothetical protein
MRLLLVCCRAGTNALDMWPVRGGFWSQWLVEAAPDQANATITSNLVGVPVTLKVVGRLPPLGTCGGQLAASQLCRNATAWAGTSGEWLLEPAGGPGLYRIRFNVSGACSALSRAAAPSQAAVFSTAPATPRLSGLPAAHACTCRGAPAASSEWPSKGAPTSALPPGATSVPQQRETGRGAVCPQLACMARVTRQA